MKAGTNAAVVVAFNRKHLLKECLDGLLRQSLPLDGIFVVDNASTDGTAAYLEENGFMKKPQVHYLRMEVNGGGAAGFYAGMKAAFEAGFEWIWLMDDDTEPEPDALERMQPMTSYPEVVAIANQKLDIHHEQTLDGLRLLPRQADRNAPYTLVKFSSFVGLLVRSSAVAKIGLPRPEFFIHNDDLEYCLRLRTVGTIALADQSKVVHKEQARQIVPSRFFGFTYLAKDLHGYCFDYFGHRNYVVTQRVHAGPLGRFLLPLRRFALAASAILLFDKEARLQRFRILLRALFDGYRDHFDNAYPFRLREELKNRG